MSEIKINYAQIDKAISKINNLKNRCLELKFDISVSSTGDCATCLEQEIINIKNVQKDMFLLLTNTEKFLKNAKSEFKNMDEVVSDKFSEG